MFKITANGSIKMSKGDDVLFPLFVNMGTAENPLRYEFYPDKGCEVYFYLFNVNDIDNEPVLIKVFTDSGKIFTKVHGTELEPEEGVENINENRDMVLRIRHKDTSRTNVVGGIDAGLYKYQIKAKLLDPEVNTREEFKYNTLTNKEDFYLLDDDYGDRVWGV